MNIKAVVFDLYGTLAFIRNKKNPFVELLRAAERDKIRKLVLNNFSNVRDLINTLGASLPEEAINKIENDISGELESVALFSETLDILSWQKRSGYKLGLISNLATPYKRPFFDLKLHQLIDCWIFSCDVEIAKPDERIYQLMADKLHLKSSEIIMVGDSLTSDVMGSKKAGFNSILLDRKNTSKTSEKIRTLEELRRIL